MIRDIGKGIMTDKCIAFLLFLVVGGVIALVIVKVIQPNKKNIASAVSSIPFNSSVLTNNTVTSGISNVWGTITSTANLASGTSKRRLAAMRLLYGALAESMMADEDPTTYLF